MYVPICFNFPRPFEPYVIGNNKGVGTHYAQHWPTLSNVTEEWGGLLHTAQRKDKLFMYISESLKTLHKALFNFDTKISVYLIKVKCNAILV